MCSLAECALLSRCDDALDIYFVVVVVVVVVVSVPFHQSDEVAATVVVHNFLPLPHAFLGSKTKRLACKNWNRIRDSNGTGAMRGRPCNGCSSKDYDAAPTLPWSHLRQQQRYQHRQWQQRQGKNQPQRRQRFYRHQTRER